MQKLWSKSFCKLFIKIKIGALKKLSHEKEANKRKAQNNEEAKNYQTKGYEATTIVLVAVGVSAKNKKLPRGSFLQSGVMLL
jgi:uncharacterized membrane protein YgdD (TMEM256/DUF423 family)